MPTSQASCPRHTTWPLALRPVSGSTSFTCRRSGTSAPTTAMQPEWLTSTVSPLAVRRAAPSSHSRRKRRLVVARGWDRMLAQRSASALLWSISLSGVIVYMKDLAGKSFGWATVYHPNPARALRQWYGAENVLSRRGAGTPSQGRAGAQKRAGKRRARSALPERVTGGITLREAQGHWISGGEPSSWLRQLPGA